MRLMFAGKYFKILVGSRLAGGVLVFERDGGHYEVERIFLDPALRRRGLALRTLRLLEEALPPAWAWFADVPAEDWAARRLFEHAGYTRLGWRVPPDGPELVVYVKRPR